MRITGLNVYLVKSLQGIALEMARLPETGLAFDKHFGEISVLGEPLCTLLKMNTRSLKGGFFGQHAILLDGEGRVLSLGDRLAVMPASGAGLCGRHSHAMTF